MGSRRTYGSYNDGCAAAHALDLIGERWTMIVVRELLLGPKRFSDLHRDVVGVGPAVLTRRLRELTTAGLVDRRRLPGPGRVDIYELTRWGYELESVNSALSLWAVGSPALPLEADMSPDTVVLAMRAHARPTPGPPGQTVALELRDSRRDDADAAVYLARLTPEGTTVERVLETGPVDASVTATTRSWKAVVISGVPLPALPDVRMSGEPAAVKRLVAATSLGRERLPEQPAARSEAPPRLTDIPRGGI
jgi:DNA-binding HxlR family transcriptional regulator